jgi:hypothetical protein
MASHVVKSSDPKRQLKSVGYEKLAVSSTSVPLAAVPATALAALIVVETNTVRWRCDADPSATDGSPLAANDSLYLESRDALLDIEFIRASADATLQVVYFG